MKLVLLVNLGISMAMTVRVGNAVGRRDAPGVRRAAASGAIFNSHDVDAIEAQVERSSWEAQYRRCGKLLDEALVCMKRLADSLKHSTAVTPGMAAAFAGAATGGAWATDSQAAETASELEVTDGGVAVAVDTPTAPTLPGSVNEDSVRAATPTTVATS